MNQGKLMHDTIHNLIAAELYFAQWQRRDGLSLNEEGNAPGPVEQFNRLRELMVQFRDEHGCDFQFFWIREKQSSTTG